MASSIVMNRSTGPSLPDLRQRATRLVVFGDRCANAWSTIRTDSELADAKVSDDRARALSSRHDKTADARVAQSDSDPAEDPFGQFGSALSAVAILSQFDRVRRSRRCDGYRSAFQLWQRPLECRTDCRVGTVDGQKIHAQNRPGPLEFCKLLQRSLSAAA